MKYTQDYKVNDQWIKVIECASGHALFTNDEFEFHLRIDFFEIDSTINIDCTCVVR